MFERSLSNLTAMRYSDMSRLCISYKSTRLQDIMPLSRWLLSFRLLGVSLMFQSGLRSPCLQHRAVKTAAYVPTYRRHGLNESIVGRRKEVQVILSSHSWLVSSKVRIVSEIRPQDQGIANQPHGLPPLFDYHVGIDSGR